MSTGRRRLLESIVATLLVAEGLQFLLLAHGIREMFLGAQNVAAADSLPPAVWSNVVIGIMCIGAGAAYVASATFRQWFAPLAFLALGYGLWAALSGHRLMVSWLAVLEGDAVALGVWSGLGFILLGTIDLLSRHR